MLLKALDKTVAKVGLQIIPENRKEIVNTLVAYIQEKLKENQPVLLTFICTHNSRRSQLAQAWAQIMGCHFGIPVKTFSGGVEVTAFYPSAIQALQSSGVRIKIKSKAKNPVVNVYYSEEKPPLVMFSKLYNDAINPSHHFVAVMTCSDADENCPFISGAEKRISLTYQDPKIADNTSFELEKYKERSMQIASEMYYVFSRVKQNNEQ